MAVGKFHRFYKFTDKIDFVKIIGFNASSFGFSYEVTVITLDVMNMSEGQNSAASEISQSLIHPVLGKTNEIHQLPLVLHIAVKQKFYNTNFEIWVIL